MTEEDKPTEPVQAFNTGPKAQFPEVIKIQPCTSNECGNGHKWPAQLALAGCPGCGSPILMVRMVNCPICNEAVKVFKLRTDHAAPQMGIAAICRQQGGPAETNEIVMERNAAKECMEKWNPETGRMS